MMPDRPPLLINYLIPDRMTAFTTRWRPLTGFVLAFLIACSPSTPATESNDSGTAGGRQDVAPAGASLPPDTPVSSDDTGAPQMVPQAPDAGAPSAAAPPATSGMSPASTGGGGSSGATGSTGQAQSPSLDAVIDRAARAYASARTARGTFTQTLVNQQIGSTARSAGTFMRQQPDKFAFEFSDPAGDRIVADGRHVWLYLPSTNPGQVLRNTLTPTSAGSYDLGSLFFERTRERFEVTDGGNETLGDRTARVLRLTPRSTAPFTRGTVWVEESSGSLLQFTVVDEMGLERTVRITSQEINVPVPAGSFVFEVPDGVRVVDTESIGQQGPPRQN